jgi:glycosyltransferase involved in cell wall biosynthesis
VSAPRRIGVDLCRIDPAALRPADHAVLDTLEAVAAAAPSDVELVLLSSKALASARPSLFEAFESRTAPFPPGAAAARVAAGLSWLPWAVGRARLDALHDPAGTSPVRTDLATIVSVQDLSPLDRPRGVGRLRVAYHRRVVPRALTAARTVLVPSAFVERRLVEAFAVDPTKVRVVPWPLPPHAEPAPIDTVRARHGIIGRIVLLPAPTDPEQEHLVAVRAMRHLAGRHGETTLVLLGPEGAAEKQVDGEIRSLGLEERVVRLRDVSPAVRSALFEHAVAVVHPSVYDGFADSVLEAMACGVPVVVSDVGAAPELVEGAGAVFPHGDDAQLAIEVHRVLDDPEWRRRMVDDGLQRARSYTAPVAAEALLTAYRSVTADL